MTTYETCSGVIGSDGRCQECGTAVWNTAGSHIRQIVGAAPTLAAADENRALLALVANVVEGMIERVAGRTRCMMCNATTFTVGAAPYHAPGCPFEALNSERSRIAAGLAVIEAERAQAATKAEAERDAARADAQRLAAMVEDRVAPEETARLRAEVAALTQRAGREAIEEMEARARAEGADLGSAAIHTRAIEEAEERGAAWHSAYTSAQERGAATVVVDPIDVEAGRAARRTARGKR